MNDRELRDAFVRKKLMRGKPPRLRLFHEFSLEHGSTRIDILVVSSILHGYELKSDRDSLRRLPNQARIYSAILDKVTLVTSYLHALDALDIIPSWWGVTLAHEGRREAIHFEPARSAKRNPAVNAKALAELLWRGEALDLLRALGFDSGFYSKRRDRIYERVVEVAGIPGIHDAVIRQLHERTIDQLAEPQMSSGG
jgi:hypothetical protein